MDRELLLEIGCEELPASWLPELTREIGDVLAAQLREHRLAPTSPAETFSTPRRLTARVARLSERQNDLEELVTGPPVSAGFAADGTPTPAATGFAAKQGVQVGALERVDTPKGAYLAFRRKQRGRAAVDVLPQVLEGTLRGLTFPKLMHWDALLEDGRGELLFGRPIRWILYLYGGRVVPFTISRKPVAQTGQVREVISEAVTYGHRFLTTSGRAGRAIKVRSFDEYRTKLLENFVILERAERHDKIKRELDAKAQRLQGRVSHAAPGESELLDEVPDLVEYPSVVAGTFPPEFLSLPEEVLTTTLIRHQHYFPVESTGGQLKNAFLAVTNTEPDNERSIARNAERVVTARLRDARFFWDADREIDLTERVDRLATILFHKALGTYLEKAVRVEALAAGVAAGSLELEASRVEQARLAARLCKGDLTTDMVREFPELQGKMGGVYARAQGYEKAVADAIYHHYQPTSADPDSGPTRGDLGDAPEVWAAVSLADKLDSVVGLFIAGERPTGTRDPFAMRRQAQGLLRILLELPELTGVDRVVDLSALCLTAAAAYGALPADGGPGAGGRDRLFEEIAAFLGDRLRYLLSLRGFRLDEINAVAALGTRFVDRPLATRRKLEALRELRGLPEFQALAELFKRVKNISKGTAFPEAGWDVLSEYGGGSQEASEQALIRQAAADVTHIRRAEAEGNYVEAFKRISAFQPAVARYFDEVLVMSEDRAVRARRLELMAGLRDLVLETADISEIASSA
jgi:glycyl-tRNA synthetase beta chain